MLVSALRRKAARQTNRTRDGRISFFCRPPPGWVAAERIFMSFSFAMTETVFSSNDVVFSHWLRKIGKPWAINTTIKHCSRTATNSCVQRIGKVRVREMNFVPLRPASNHDADKTPFLPKFVVRHFIQPVERITNDHFSVSHFEYCYIMVNQETKFGHGKDEAGFF